MPKNSLNVLDLFCGCGGMSQGLYDAGLHIVGGIDVWETAIKSYSENFEHEAFAKDLTSFTPEEFDKVRKDKAPIDVIVGGPPCQGFSIAGKRDKNDPRNSLFMAYVRYLNYFKPKAFIMENVMGILSMKTEQGEKVIDIIMTQLSEHYTCTICKVYASDFEVPQNRRRVLIIGILKDIGICPPLPDEIIKDVKDRIPVKTVLLERENVDQKLFLSKKAIEGIIRKRQKSKDEGKGFGAQILSLDKPSYTIPARYWKDGYDALVKYTDTDIRRLSILELKRIQTFPDDFSLHGSKKDMIMQIGNAVPCRLAYHLGMYLRKNIGNYT